MGTLFSDKTAVPPPLMAKPPGWQEGRFTNQFGNDLRYSFAPALGGPAKGTVILTHGYGEFIDLYAEAINEYQKMGFNVWAMDFYGFGKSGRNDPDNPHTPSSEGLKRHVDDLHEFITRIVRPDHSKPVLMNTHSMGGHIGLLYLQKYPDTFDGAVMSAPMFDIYRLGLPVLFRPVIGGIFSLASQLNMRDFSLSRISGVWSKLKEIRGFFTGEKKGGLREAFNHMTRQSMPETNIQLPTPGWLSAAFKTVAPSMTDDALRSVKTPVLIGSAGLENLVDVDAHERAAMLIPHAKLVKLPKAQHGLWFENDSNYNDWVGHVKSFVGRVTEQFKHASSPASAPERVFAARSPEIGIMPVTDRPKSRIPAVPGAIPALA